MVRQITFIAFLIISFKLYAQAEPDILQKFPGTFQNSYTEAMALEVDGEGDLQITGESMKVNMSIKITSTALLITDYDKKGQEEYKILQVASYPDNPGFYYLKVRSKVDTNIEGEAYFNKITKDKFAFILSYARGGFVFR